MHVKRLKCICPDWNLLKHIKCISIYLSRMNVCMDIFYMGLFKMKYRSIVDVSITLGNSLIEIRSTF